MRYSSFGKLINLSFSLEKKGLVKEAQIVRNIVIEAGIIDKLKGAIDAAATATMKATLNHFKDLVKKDPVKVAKYIIGLTAWLVKLHSVLKTIAPKKASLKITSRDWLSTLRDVAIIVAAVVHIAHGLADNPKLSPQIREDLVKTKDIATTVTHEFNLNGLQLAFQHQTLETRTEVDSKIPKSQYEKEQKILKE